MKSACVTLIIAIALCLAAGMIGASLAATPPSPPPAAQPAETEEFLVISVEMWNKVERALSYWFEEAQRLKQSKGCA